MTCFSIPITMHEMLCMDIRHMTFKQKKLTDKLTKDTAKAEV